MNTCNKAFYHAAKLIEHYEQHNIKICKQIKCTVYTTIIGSCWYRRRIIIIGTERKNFPSWEAFFSWKESEEEATHLFCPAKG